MAHDEFSEASKLSQRIKESGLMVLRVTRGCNPELQLGFPYYQASSTLGLKRCFKPFGEKTFTQIYRKYIGTL